MIYVRYGSLADKVTSPGHVRFTPNNGRWTTHPIQHFFGCAFMSTRTSSGSAEAHGESAIARIGTFGQTGTLGDLIHRLLPALLKLFHRLQRGIPVSGISGETCCSILRLATASSTASRARASVFDASKSAIA